MHLRLAALLLVALTLTGCVQRFDATRLGVPATMATPGPPPQGEAFRVNGSSVYGVLGLFTISQASLEKALARQLVGGRAVTNLRITVKSRFSDLLISGLTLGLIIPRTVTFEGVVVP